MDRYKLTAKGPKEEMSRLADVIGYGPFDEVGIIDIDEDYRFGCYGNVVSFAEELAEAAHNCSFSFEGYTASEVSDDVDYFNAKYEKNTIKIKHTNICRDKFLDMWFDDWIEKFPIDDFKKVFKVKGLRKDRYRKCIWVFAELAFEGLTLLEIPYEDFAEKIINNKASIEIEEKDYHNALEESIKKYGIMDIEKFCEDAKEAVYAAIERGEYDEESIITVD